MRLASCPAATDTLFLSPQQQQSNDFHHFFALLPPVRPCLPTAILSL